MAFRSVVQRTIFNGSIASALAQKNGAREYGKFLNTVQLLGRAGHEPRRIGETEITFFPLFTEHSFKSADGEAKNFPCWHRVVIMRRGLSEIVTNSLDRGQRVYVQGRLAYRPLPNSEHVSDQRAFIIAEEIIMLEKSRKQTLEKEDMSEPIKETVEL